MNVQSNETQWYIARDGKQHGPLTEIEMRTFVAHNYLRPSDLIWRPGLAEWQLAPTLFPAVFPNQPASPAASAEIAPPAAPPVKFEMGGPKPAAPVSQPISKQNRDMRPVAEGAERSGGRRLAIAAAALTIIGGAAFGFAAYRSTLSSVVSSETVSAPSSDGGPPVASTPQIAAAPEAAPNTAAAVIETAPSTTDVVTQPPVETAAAAPARDETTTPVSPAPQTMTAAIEPPSGLGASSVAPPADAPVQPSVTGSTVDMRLQKIPAWALIKKQYPDWYQTNISSAEQLAAEQKPPSEVSTYIAQSLVALRRQNADKALSASSDKLKRVAVAYLDNLKALRAQSVTACYGFISRGETSPSVVQLVDTADGPTAFHSQLAAIFEAIAEGTATPVKHDAAVKADYDLLIKELGKLGWKEEDLQVFSNPRLLAKREPDNVCKMVQEWFVAHLAVPDQAARDRLLYETLKPVISG